MKGAAEPRRRSCFATLAHTPLLAFSYAGGGTETFTDGRSSIFWWKASSFG